MFVPGPAGDDFAPYRVPTALVLFRKGRVRHFGSRFVPVHRFDAQFALTPGVLVARGLLGLGARHTRENAGPQMVVLLSQGFP